METLLEARHRLNYFHDRHVLAARGGAEKIRVETDSRRAREGREMKIRSDIQRAEEAGNADAEALRQQYQTQLVDAQKTIQSMVNQAKADGERLRSDIVAQAKQEADRALEKGRRELGTETERLRGELRKEVAGLSVSIAEKILQRAVDPKTQEAVLADALKSVGKN